MLSWPLKRKDHAAELPRKTKPFPANYQGDPLKMFKNNTCTLPLPVVT
jgi:hypothetical protein